MKYWYKGVSLLLALLMILPAAVLSGCSRSEPVSSKLTVVTSFFPLYTAAVNITDGVDGVQLLNLAQPSVGCLHDYQLTPRDMQTLEKADLLIVNGMGMEEFLDNVFTSMPDLPVVCATDGITAIEEEGGHSHEHHESEEQDGGHHHDHNAHAWVSVSNYIRYVENICAALCSADPENAESYTSNAAAYTQKLTELRDRMEAELADISRRDIITFHEAFSYFADEFGLHVAAVLEREPGMGPSASELAGTVDLVRETGCKVLFVEPQYSSSIADVVARDTGARIYTLDPVVTGDEHDKDAYLKAMEQNLKVLKDALK
ncbi:MAG: zinc ABC transporter substrate-binding protein [Clostridiales bacterium]|nr:zinc ABC transporter substrate-binding protein [Clostridiales bacterium]